MDMSLRTEYPVDIILPKKWWGIVTYRLKESIVVDGTLIPSHFESDGATTPRWTWVVFPPVCRYFPAALLHDFLLKQGLPWRVANRRFRKTLKALRIVWWRRYLMSVSVAIYGTYRRVFHGDD